MTTALPFDGRGVVISGGSRGIGRACAIRFAQLGADVVLQYHAHPDAAESTVRAIRSIGRRAWAVAGNAAHRDDARRLVRAAEESMGSIHVVVVNAGVDGSGPIESTSEVSFRRTTDIDLYGGFALLQAAEVPLSATAGSAVLISSISALGADRDSIDYSAAKAGLLAVNRGVAAAFAPRVRVNAVLPGFVRTELTQSVWEDASRLERVRRTIPLRRIGNPEDVAGAVAFLASDRARFITGAALVVDGGAQHYWSMGAGNGEG